MKLRIEQLKPRLWSDLESLFGPNGACGGCWCMYWRQRKGEKWEDVKGTENKRRLKKLVAEGKAHGALAYAGGHPVGWVSFDRRTDLPKLDRAPSLRCEDASEVWSIPCFYVKAPYRGKGVATQLLAFAVGSLRRAQAKIVEGYHVKAKERNIPAAFAWTGTTSLFRKAGFKPVGKRDAGKQRMRRRGLAVAPRQRLQINV